MQLFDGKSGPQMIESRKGRKIDLFSDGKWQMESSIVSTTAIGSLGKQTRMHAHIGGKGCRMPVCLVNCINSFFSPLLKQ